MDSQNGWLAIPRSQISGDPAAKGWFKIHRSLLIHPIVTLCSPIVLKVWLICLGQANWQPTKSYDGHSQILIPRGAFIFTQEKFAEFCQISRKQLRVALKHLQNLGCVAIRRANKTSLLVIENWDAYQLDGPEKGQVEGQTTAIEGPREGHERARLYKEEELRSKKQLPSPADADWPATTWAITQRFETASSKFVCRVIEAAFVALHKNGGQPSDLDDPVLAGIIRDAIQAKPRGEAGLLLDTVPEIIESRLLREKRRKAASEAADRRRGPEPASRSQEGLFLLQEKER